MTQMMDQVQLWTVVAEQFNTVKDSWREQSAGLDSTGIVQEKPRTEETQELNVIWGETWWFYCVTMCSLSTPNN